MNPVARHLITLAIAFIVSLLSAIAILLHPNILAALIFTIAESILPAAIIVILIHFSVTLLCVQYSIHVARSDEPTKIKRRVIGMVAFGYLIYIGIFALRYFPEGPVM